MKLKAILIDDEISSIETLEIELNRHCPKVEVIAKYNDPMQAVEVIPSMEFDVLFLDIEMPWLNGFDLLNQLKNINFEVVFITAYDQYAIQAFKVSAIDYLLKPIQAEELQSAVDRCIKRRSSSLNNVPIKNLINNLNKKNIGERKLLLPTAEGIDFITIGDIIHCNAESNYTRIITKDRQIFLAKTLKEIEEMLAEYNFFRVHSSHLVNIDYIKRYSRSEGVLVMSNDQNISVSRLRKDAFLTFLASQ